MKIPLLSVFIFVLSFCSVRGMNQHNKKHTKVTAQSSSDQNTTMKYNHSLSDSKILERSILHIPKDYYLFYKEDLSKSKIPAYLAITALTGALMTVDEKGWEYNRSMYERSPIFHRINDLSVTLGEGKYHLLLAGLFSVYGILGSNTKYLKTGSNILETFLASGICVQLLKHLSGRESPILSTVSGGRWRILPNLDKYNDIQPKYYSFPSGHMASATATLTVIANNFPQLKWIKPVGYSLLALLGVGLVSHGMHWYSDLPLGFFIGYSFGNLIAPVKTEGQISSTQSKISKLTLSPYLYGHNFELDLNYRF